MRSERDKMVAGELYDPFDPELMALRERAHGLCRDFNEVRAFDAAARRGLLQQLFGSELADVTIEPPFLCDYGFNIRFGRHCFVNFNCVMLDIAAIDFGEHVLLGPGVQVYAASHPLDAMVRRTLECGKPVHVGDDVWIGGGAIICPGVRIGARSVIGAGSVVVRDIPENVLAAGNPCHVVRSLTR